MRNPQDPRGHPAEDDVAAPLGPDRVGAGAVDGRPDELRPRLGQLDGRRVQRLAVRDRAHVDLEPVLAEPADEALREIGAEAADVASGRDLGLVEGHRRGRLDVERGRARLGDERLPVEQARGGAVAHDRKRALERWRQPERDLDRARVPVHEGGETPRRVAPVRGRERAAEPPLEGDLHGVSVLSRLGL